MNNKSENNTTTSLSDQKMNKNMTPEFNKNESSYMPNVDIFETEKDINLVSELSGVEEKDLEVMLENNVLTISAKMKEEKFEDYELIYSEYKPVRYERSFTISDEYDKSKLKATFKNGLLNLNIPKAEKTVAKKIAVKIL
jgi:HSP20 family molecular chaperone IbpA